MSVSKTYSIHCNNCGRWIGEEDCLKDAREFAKREGFKRVRVPNGSMWDFCPTCVVRYENGEIK